MRGGTRSGAGRKSVEIDLDNLEKLCAMDATDEEIAAFFNVSTRTIESRRRQRQFADTMRRGRAKGRLSIRRAQMKLMEAGSVPMTIWLGKQRLGQRDVTPVELSGLQGQPVQIDLAALDAILDQARAK